MPMAGAVLNTLNTWLDAEHPGIHVDHGEPGPWIVDPSSPLNGRALKLRQSTAPIYVIQVRRPGLRQGG